MSLFHCLAILTLFVGANTFAGPVSNDDYTTISIRPMDRYYPAEAWTMDPRFKVKIEKRQSPWYETKWKECKRIFAAGQLQAQAAKWDGLDRNLFLQRLDHKGARGIASVYPLIPLSQLQNAEAELHRVKAEP